MTETKESLKKEESEVTDGIKTDMSGSTGMTASQREIKKERFDFVLTSNGTIICQRYFHIHNFNPKSLTSAELYQAVSRCVEMIQTDLKWKTQVYLEAIAPQVFNSVEEMNRFLARPTHHLWCGQMINIKGTDESYVLCNDTYDRIKGEFYDEYYIHTDSKVRPYTGKDMNFYDTVKNDDSIPCTLKFAFRDNGEEAVSFSWDGNVYPRFVRTNIDLTNRKNRYMTNDDKRKSLEWQLVEMMRQVGEDKKTGKMMYRTDLTGVIAREICECCSQDKDNDTYVKNDGRFDYSINSWDNSVSYHRRPKREGKRKVNE